MKKSQNKENVSESMLWWTESMMSAMNYILNLEGNKAHQTSSQLGMNSFCNSPYISTFHPVHLSD